VCGKYFSKADMVALGFGHLLTSKNMLISVSGGEQGLVDLVADDEVPINWKATRGASHGPETTGWTLHMILVAQAAKMDTDEEAEEKKKKKNVEDDEDEEEDEVDGDEEVDEDVEVDEHLYCVCHKREPDMMVACDTEQCPHGEWFHLGCVGLTTPPPEGSPWFCKECMRGTAVAAVAAAADMREEDEEEDEEL
jgi:hypothetical protein